MWDGRWAGEVIMWVIRANPSRTIRKEKIVAAEFSP
jgi:hypothetical protein